jgi:NAD-dependent dihydropyrimidine dehydrogenase PreA subunit
MWKITINKEKCSGCGECLSNCPGDVYELHESKAVIANPKKCHGCRTCEDTCPEEAIEIEEE